MNLFLCLILLIYHSYGYDYKVEKKYVVSSTSDYIKAIKYKGRSLENNALVEIDLAASCSTCSTNFIGIILIKDAEGNVLDRFQKSAKFTGTYTLNMAIDDSLFEENSTLNLATNITFPSNKVFEDQQQIASIELENIGESIFDVSKNLLSYRKKCPYFVEKSNDGSLIKLYESYAFNESIIGNFDTNEIDIRQLSFQYSDSSLNEIPIYYGNAYLLIDGVFEKSDIDTKDGKYYFPLDITCKEYKCSFSFMQNYYFDYNLDMLFSTYQASRIATNTLKLPSNFDTTKTIPYQIVIEDAGAYGDEITINGTFKVSYKLFGACENSKYCVGKTNGFSGDIEYEQTVEISS